jgi:hypothetical protein
MTLRRGPIVRKCSPSMAQLCWNYCQAGTQSENIRIP